jgi:hypothetical protein
MRKFDQRQFLSVMLAPVSYFVSGDIEATSKSFIGGQL